MGVLRLRFDDVLDQVKAYKPDCDENLLRRAYVFAGMAHKGQVRLSGEPYLSHPLAVAEILAEMRLDEVAIVGGFLHDLLEDTDVTEAQLAEQFGSTVANLVKALTKITALEESYAAREAAQAETFRRMLLASVEDIRVLLVKLADRLHNMRTLHFLEDEAKRRRIAQETLDIYAPLAHRLGIGNCKAELEDLAFAELFPTEAKALADELQARQERAQEAIDEIRTELGKLLTQNAITHEVRFRIKHLYSVWRKLRSQGVSIEQLYDFLAFRVIVDSIAQCYEVLGLVHQRWVPIPGRFKDYISVPKSNLYQSLHTSLMGPEGLAFEVQIRTREMDDVAERGVAAHWLYKEAKDPTRYHEAFPWLRNLVEGQHSNPQEFLDALKLDLYPEEVFCFTPQGKVIRLPKGATPVDFAYAVHTEIGHKCVGARVNGKQVPLGTQLKTGDKVEIQTSVNQVPRRGWLEFVVTGRARSKIRAFLRKTEKERAKLLGRKLLEREASRLGLLGKGSNEGLVLKELAEKLGFAKEDELLTAVGLNQVGPREVLSSLVKDREDTLSLPVHRRPRGHEQEKMPVEVKGDRDFLTYRARCCRPLPGDPIIGFVTRGRGVAIHRQGCPNFRKLAAMPERQVEVCWGTSEGSFAMPLVVLFEDRPGMLAAISQAVSTAGGNIRSCQLATADGCGVVHLEVEVADRAQLNRVMSLVHRIAGVTQVEIRRHDVSPTRLG